MYAVCCYVHCTDPSWKPEHNHTNNVNKMKIVCMCVCVCVCVCMHMCATAAEHIFKFNIYNGSWTALAVPADTKFPSMQNDNFWYLSSEDLLKLYLVTAGLCLRQSGRHQLKLHLLAEVCLTRTLEKKRKKSVLPDFKITRSQAEPPVILREFWRVPTVFCTNKGFQSSWGSSEGCPLYFVPMKDYITQSLKVP